MKIHGNFGKNNGMYRHGKYCKRYIAYCVDCGKKIDSPNAKRCLKCARIGKLHPNFKDGRSLKQHYCIDCTKKINWKSIRCQKCYHKTTKGKHPKNEFKKGHHLNKGKKKPNFSGKNHPRFGKIAKNSKGSYYKQSWMRSTWEVAFAKYCIINHIKYRYEPKAFEIIYKCKCIKKEGTYRPDFYLLERNLWIEIKGWWRDNAKAKFNAFRKQYKDIKIKVLYKKELKNLGVLK